MATMTTMPTLPPDDGGVRPDRSEKNQTVATADHEDWARELREQIKRNMEETIREQEKEIEDEIRVQLDEAIRSGMQSAEDRKDYLSRLRHAKEQRLGRMRAMLLEEGEERIREERILKQWSVDGDFPTGDSELAEAFKREQQAILHNFVKDGRNSTSSSHTAQKTRSSSPPPATSFASKPPETIRPSAPRISTTNSASSAHILYLPTYHQQQRETSEQYIWKPLVQPSEIGHSRTSSISANANAGSSTPQRVGSKADNSARWRVGANVSYASMGAIQSPYIPYHSAQTLAPTPTPSPCPSPYSDIHIELQPPTSWLDDLTTGFFYDVPEDISEYDAIPGQAWYGSWIGMPPNDEYSEDNAMPSQARYGSWIGMPPNDEYIEDDAMPSQAWYGSRRGMPPKSSPRIIQGDRGRGRGRSQGVRATLSSQHHYEVKHSSTDLRGKYETSQPRAVPSVNVNINRGTERSYVFENAREEHKPPKVWKPTSDGHGEDSRPQARPIPSTSTIRNQEHSAYGEGTTFGSYGSYGSSPNLGYGLPSRRPSGAIVVPLPMTPEEREKLERENPELREVHKKWEKMDKDMIMGFLNRAEEEFSIHSSTHSPSDKMREFVLTIHSWCVDLGLSSSHEFPDLERIFTIMLENCPMDDLITIINDECSPNGRTCLINLLHEMLQFENELEDRRRLDRLLARIVKETGQIPSSIIIEEVTRNGLNPVAGGGFADVWGGMRGNMNVALKVLRVFGEGELNKQILWAFCAEVLLWHRLHHSNVMPFLGVCVTEFAPRYALVSPWMKNGHLLEYLRKHPLSDRRALMLGIAKGMEYLHSLKPAVIHGDLRSPNILIDDDGQPRISDFGLARLFVSEGGPLTQTSFRGQGSVWWQAPELLYPSKFSDIESGPTKSSDVYAFACVCIEIFAEKAPFSGLTDVQVIIEVGVNDGRPPRPPPPAEERGLSDEVWSLIQECWAVQPADRPSMTTVCTRIQDIVAK